MTLGDFSCAEPCLRTSRPAPAKALPLVVAVSIQAMCWAAPARADESSTQAAMGDTSGVTPADIIVTARKRQESILKVPVVVTALEASQLENIQVTQITDLPKLVPGLVLGGNLLSIGPQVTIRGVGTSSSDPGVDQSVSLNIDGLSLGQGLAFGSGMFDVAQVEVLKGPQVLFFGKSSPGGVISLRTADPGDRFEVVARAGYEIEAREKRGELIVSGPLSETFGARLATTYSDGEGFFINRAVPIPGTGAARPFEREPQPRNFIIRGTLLWKPDSALSVRLKVNHAYDRLINAEQFQLAACPEGNQALGFRSGVPGSGIPAAPNFLTPLDPVPFIGGDDCKLNRYSNVSYMDPSFYPGINNNGVPFLRNKQDYGTFEVNYDVLPDITLSSVTAYYKLNSASLVNSAHTTGPGVPLAVRNKFQRREFTEELRLNSDFSGPVNFTLGAFYEDGRLFDEVQFYRNRAYGFLSPAVVGREILNDHRSTTVDITTYSLFGQLRYKLSDQLELAGGVRWTDEERKEHVFDYLTNTDITPTLPRPRVHSSNFSPEATITYTPTDDLTLFASYKKGYKSGSFKVAVPALRGENNAFDDEQVQGYEIGAKSRFGALYANLAFYDYYYRGLQVGGIEPTTSGVPIIRTVNAGKSRSYGVDFDMRYRAAEGLNLTASVNWNRARYADLANIPCYTGQTVSQGCVNFFVPSTSQTAPGPTGAVLVSGKYGFYTGQDLSGAQMIRAPEWAANVGFDYEAPVGSDLKLRVSNNNQISARYPVFLAIGRPNEDNFQKGFVKLDASIALMDHNERWELALIGKNISNKITGSTCAATNFAGGNAISGAITGGTSSGAPGISEKGCYADMGRSIWLRLTYRPAN